MNETILRNLHVVATGLGDILDQVVFVGGATVEFYATVAGAPQARPTIDVDCIIEISSYPAYTLLEGILRQRGFRNDQSQGAPLCRWIYEGVTVDVMPTGTNVLGFTNEWYTGGIQHTFDITLPQGQRLKLLQASYFLATKLAALKNRGLRDLRLSRDFEDVVYVLRNRDSILDDIHGTDDKVKRYLSKTFQELLLQEDIDEAIQAVLDFGEPPATASMVRSVMEAISRVWTA